MHKWKKDLLQIFNSLQKKDTNRYILQEYTENK
jgi:hypothetical protein